MCRLFLITGDENYLSSCHKIFNSFLPLKSKNNEYWVCCVDSKSNLWLEEYPNEIPSHTLNGMIFSIYGIYDYYILTKKTFAKKILQGSLRTIKYNIDNFRNIGGASYYTSKNKFIAEEYHILHIEQLKMLYAITLDSAFLKSAEEFESDFQPKQ